MKNKTFKILLLVLILIMAFLIIRNTYSKYITESMSSSKLNISRWNIKLNNEAIKNKADFSEDIQIEYKENPNAAQGVVVPTSKGTFSLELESTGTDLPYEYKISFLNTERRSFKINSVTPGDNSTTPYFYNITFNITNDISEFNPWNLVFDVPETLVTDSCSINGFDSYTITNNTINLTSNEVFALHETKTFTLTLATMNEMDFDMTNVFLNNTNLDIPTDRIQDFRVTSYSINSGEEIKIPLTQTSITGTVIPPSDLSVEVKNTFNFTVEWYDEDDNYLNNFNDVAAYKQNLPATIPVNLSVTQLLTSAP